jgi:hypothetical protein
MDGTSERSDLAAGSVETVAARRDKKRIKREKRGDIGEWFILGKHQQLLEQNCLSLARDFEREEDSLKVKIPALSKSLDALVYHVKDLNKYNSIGGDSTFDWKIEVAKWCSVASLFLCNRNLYRLLKSCDENDDWGAAEEVIDGSAQWPPLPHDWFDFEKSFDALHASRDRLYWQCGLAGIDCPEEDAISCDPAYIGSANDQHLQRLKRENSVDEGKKYWHIIVVSHLKALIRHKEEMANRV